jgi:LmbE family N-acetylglucosaminyl deacetylase
MAGLGIEEAEWLDVLGSLPEWEPPRTPTLIIAPHPDDETLGAGGLISAQRARGLEVHVAAVTDGEKAYPNMPHLGSLREKEQVEALEQLSVTSDCITRFRFPDGSVASCEEEMERRLAPLISRDTLVVAPWRGDHHPDHEACGRIAEKLAKRWGATLCSYFFWMWHWGSVGEIGTLPAYRFLLKQDLLLAKSQALACHRTQLEHEDGRPILPELLLRPARRPFEVFAIE